AVSDIATALKTRPYSDLDALIGDVDALTLAVPPDVQAEIATRAAESGKHLLLEKPIATSTLAAARLERAVTEASVASIVFFTRRFLPEPASWLQEVIATGGWDCGRAEVCASIFAAGNPFA